MQKQRDHSQLKDQENSYEGKNNETDLFNPIDTEFKKEVIKILKELRRTINRNADHCNKDLEMIMSHSKLDKSVTDVKTKSQAKNSKFNNAEE